MPNGCGSPDEASIGTRAGAAPCWPKLRACCPPGTPPAGARVPAPLGGSARGAATLGRPGAVAEWLRSGRLAAARDPERDALLARAGRGSDLVYLPSGAPAGVRSGSSCPVVPKPPFAPWRERSRRLDIPPGPPSAVRRVARRTHPSSVSRRLTPGPMRDRGWWGHRGATRRKRERRGYDASRTPTTYSIRPGTNCTPARGGELEHPAPGAPPEPRLGAGAALAPRGPDPRRASVLARVRARARGAGGQLERLAAATRLELSRSTRRASIGLAPIPEGEAGRSPPAGQQSRSRSTQRDSRSSRAGRSAQWVFAYLLPMLLAWRTIRPGCRYADPPVAYLAPRDQPGGRPSYV